MQLTKSIYLALASLCAAILLCNAYDPELPMSEVNRPYLYGMPQPRHTLPGRKRGFNKTRGIPRPEGAVYTFPSRLSESVLARMKPHLRKSYHQHRIGKMIEWGEANGVRINPLIFFNVTESGTSIHARHNIPKGDEIFGVPINIIVSERTAKDKGPFGWFQQWQHPQEPLIMFLLHEMSNGTSRYRPWLDAWPAVEDGYHHYSPIAWTNEELREQLPDFVNAITPHQNQIVESYERLRKTLVERLPEVILDIDLPPESADFDPWRFIEFFTYERFKYAWMMDATRRHACPDLIEAPSCIIPFMDMFSHEPGIGGVSPPHVNEYEPLHAVMQTNQRYEKGEELKCSYSNGASNSYLLSYYGFVVPDQPFDHVYVDLSRYASPQNNMLAYIALGNFTKAFITRRGPPLLALHAMRANVSAEIGAPRPFGGRAPAGSQSIFAYGDTNSKLDTHLVRAKGADWSHAEALRLLRAFQPISVDIELKAILKMLDILNPLTISNKGDYSTAYPYFAYQSLIATERAFRKTLDQSLYSPTSPRRDPREKFRYASMLREEQFKLHHHAVKYLMKRRAYILEHCILPPFDWKEDWVQNIQPVN